MIFVNKICFENHLKWNYQSHSKIFADEGMVDINIFKYGFLKNKVNPALEIEIFYLVSLYVIQILYRIKKENSFRR